MSSFNKIKKRLGGQNLKAAEIALSEQNFHKAAEIALKYYDKSYQFLLENNSAPQIYMLPLAQFEPESNATTLIEFCNSLTNQFTKIDT